MGGLFFNGGHAGASIPEAQGPFKPETADQNLSLGGSRGPFSFVKENGPLVRVPCAAWGTQSSASRCKNCNFAYNCPQYKQ